ncbi:hypothetical protein N2152v2_004027 [Parachlorella kessleri]
MPLTSQHTKRHMLAIFKEPAASELVADAAAEKCGIPSFVANPPLTAPTRRLYFVCLSEVTQQQPASLTGDAARATPRLGDSGRPLPLACGSVATVSFTAGYTGTEPLQMSLPRLLKSNKVLEHVSNAGEQAPLNSVLGACLSKDLGHPNLIMTYDWATLALEDTLDGQAAPQGMQTLSLWIIQEYANCGSLNDAIERGDFKVTPTPNSQPNMPHVLLTAKDTAGAVSYMHGHGILHGDLTGSNVLLTSHVLGDDRGFCAKVADFKLARVIQGTDSFTTRTCGTATHCPPELLEDGSLSPAGDAWAFGILLWEMASGQRAFKGMRDAQSLVERCLDKDPKQRPDFDQIVLDLENQLGTTSSLQQDKERLQYHMLCEQEAGAAAAVTVPSIPTRLNSIPHSRETRQHFYRDATQAVQNALDAGKTRLTVRCTIPELNTEFDVYRVGTLLELVRDLVLMLTSDGKKVKVCVQQALGQGVFQGTPLTLSGVTRILKQMDWGDATPFLTTGNIKASEVDDAEAYILVAPQNIVGHSILPFLTEMVEAAEAKGKCMILVNPKLGDIPSANGVMGVMGRQERQDFTSSFETAYHFRLLYIGAGMYPIMGAARYSYGGPWEVHQRVELGLGKEEYRLIGIFDKEPRSPEITQCFRDSPH